MAIRSECLLRLLNITYVQQLSTVYSLSLKFLRLIPRITGIIIIFEKLVANNLAIDTLSYIMIVFISKIYIRSGLETIFTKRYSDDLTVVNFRPVGVGCGKSHYG